MPLTPVRTLRAFTYGVAVDGVDDYVALPLDVVRAMGTRFSFELWMRPRSYINTGEGFGALFANYLWLTSGFGLVNQAIGDRLFFLTFYNGGNSAILMDGLSRRFGRWMHVVCNYDSVVPIQELWVDAVRVGYITPVPMVYLDLAAYLRSQNMPNIYAAFRVYSRPLTYDDILQNHYSPEDPVSGGLALSLYAHPDYIRDIDNDGVLEWIDLSGNGYHGKIYGAVLTRLVKEPARALSPARVLAPAR